MMLFERWFWRKWWPWYAVWAIIVTLLFTFAFGVWS